MNRRGFFARCLAGAVLGLARNLPLPAGPEPLRVRTPLPVVLFRKLWDEHASNLILYGASAIGPDEDGKLRVFSPMEPSPANVAWMKLSNPSREVYGRCPPP